MGAKKNALLLPDSPQVVGTIYSPGSLRRALALRPGAVDLLELRVDHFAEDPETLVRAAPRLAAPLIVTVRHPDEGGAGRLAFAQRRELYARFLSVADWIDVEVRSARNLAGTLAEARACGVGTILSDHHFRGTPSLARLHDRLEAALAARADLFKIAAHAVSAANLATLLSFLDSERRRARLSVMGMGPFGKVSRLVLARAGSRLNYGYLDEPQVSGQWEATLLKQRLQELLSEE